MVGHTHLLYALAVVSCALLVTSGQGLFPGACPPRLAKHPGLEDASYFIKDIARTWYTYVRFYSPYYDDQCERFTLHAGPNSTLMRLTYHALSPRGDKVKRVAYVKPRVHPDGDVWDTEPVPDTCFDDRPFPMRLIDLNPGASCTFWSCENVVASGTNQLWRHESLWLLSATRPPRDMVLAVHNAHLVNMGLDPTNFVFVNQSNCQHGH